MFLCDCFSQMVMWRELCDRRSNKPVDMLHRHSWEGVVARATTPQALQVNGGKLWFAGCNLRTHWLLNQLWALSGGSTMWAVASFIHHKGRRKSSRWILQIGKYKKKTHYTFVPRRPATIRNNSKCKSRLEHHLRFRGCSCFLVSLLAFLFFCSLSCASKINYAKLVIIADMFYLILD